MRFQLDVFELESAPSGYRLRAADDAAPVAAAISLPGRCRVRMLRSGLQHRCTSLAEDEQTIGACRRLGLGLGPPPQVADCP